MALSPLESQVRPFGVLGFRVDPPRRTVTRPGGEEVRLEPEALDLLLVLVARRGAIVSEQELLDAVWGDRSVTGDVVPVAVYAVRQAFEDDPRRPRFVETVHRRGYRWIAAVEPDPGPGGGTRITARRFPAAVAAARRPRASPVTVAAILLLGAVSLGLVVWEQRLEGDLPAGSTLDVVHRLVRTRARGEFVADQRTVPGLRRSIEEFGRAIEDDERFAEAQAGLAQACVTLGSLVGDPDGDLEAKARRAAARAVELAPGLALAHAAAGSVAAAYDHDLSAAEASYRRALDLDPRLPLAQRRYALLLAATGRFPEALGIAEAAVRAAPTSSAAHSHLGSILMVAGRRRAAAEAFREALALGPGDLDALLSAAFNLELAGESASAWAYHRRALVVFGHPPDQVASVEASFEARGLPGVHEAWLAALGEAEGRVPEFVSALFAARAGRRSESLDHLARAVEKGEPAASWIAVHPAFHAYAGDPRFRELVERAGLAGYGADAP